MIGQMIKTVYLFLPVCFDFSAAQVESPRIAGTITNKIISGYNYEKVAFFRFCQFIMFHIVH